MTDILIRGMEMPKGCKSCKLSSDSHCNATGQWLFSTDLLRSGFNWKTCRLPDCPLVEVPKWISVEERLPEGNGTRYEYNLEESNLVLVYGINHIGEMAYGLGRYIYDHDDPKDSGWNGNMDCDYDLDYCTVTHWMPLPEPPKEVE